jgi:prohibitin 2
LAALSGFGGTALGIYSMYHSAIYKVEPGHRAIKFNKWSGVRADIYREGWHFKMPWLERAIVFDTRTHPRIISSITGSKDL